MKPSSPALRPAKGPMASSLRASLAALAVVCAALSTGCAGAERALTLEEFYGFCWPAQIDYNCSDDGLCQTYKDYLAQEHASKAECIKGCNELQLMEWRQSNLGNCQVAINNATDWCEKYCRLYFDYGPPAQAQPQGQGQDLPQQ